MDKEEKQSIQQHPPQEIEENQSFDSTKEDSTSSTSTITDSMEDASSSSSDSTNSSLNGPLYELSELVAHLPIKRGLSKYYEGKSQSFKSLTSVMSLEDLAKKENPYNRRMKLCRSYGGGRLDLHGQRFCTPKPTIAKKATSRSSFRQQWCEGMICSQPVIIFPSFLHRSRLEY